jgi:hypothetical protein
MSSRNIFNKLLSLLSSGDLDIKLNPDTILSDGSLTGSDKTLSISATVNETTPSTSQLIDVTKIIYTIQGGSTLTLPAIIMPTDLPKRLFTIENRSSQMVQVQHATPAVIAYVAPGEIATIVADFPLLSGIGSKIAKIGSQFPNLRAKFSSVPEFISINGTNPTGTPNVTYCRWYVGERGIVYGEFDLDVPFTGGSGVVGIGLPGMPRIANTSGFFATVNLNKLPSMPSINTLSSTVFAVMEMSGTPQTPRIRFMRANTTNGFEFSDMTGATSFSVSGTFSYPISGWGA